MPQDSLFQDADTRQHIAVAIASAENSLQELTARLATLRTQQATLHQRATSLQDFVALGRTLLGDDPVRGGAALTPTPAEQPGEPSSPLPVLQKPTIAMAAAQLLEDRHQPLHVTAMVTALVEQQVLKGQYPAAVLRNVLRKNPDLFKALNAKGHYALTTWRGARPPAPPERHDSNVTATQTPTLPHGCPEEDTHAT